MSDLIKENTDENDIVLDLFLGSGASVTEAIFNKRKVFGIDINPSAIFITEQIIEQVNINLFIAEYSLIERDLKQKINSFYNVKKNDDIYTGQNYLWENIELTGVRYTNGSVKRYSTLPSQSDYDLINNFSYEKVPHFFPKNSFFQNSRINTKSDKHVFKLFTAGNLTAISILHERIQQVKDEKLYKLTVFDRGCDY